MNEERIKELFSNEEYVKGLFELGSYEAVSAKLEEDDVELSPEDLKKIVELVKKKESGELTDEDLENVAGGTVVMGLGMLYAIIAAGVIGGAGAGTCVAVWKYC